MHLALHHLLEHGTLILWAAVFLEQLGLPLPAFPWLMAAGALASEGKFIPFVAVSLAIFACVLADFIWFSVGKRGNNPVLNLLCRLSPDPDSCLRRAQTVFRRFGMRAVIAAKFLPGASTVIPVLAARSQINAARFFLYDSLGASLYAGLYVLMGFVFRAQLEQVGNALLSLGRGTFGLILALSLTYFGFRFYQKRKTIRELNIARMAVAQLRQDPQATTPVLLDSSVIARPPK